MMLIQCSSSHGVRAGLLQVDDILSRIVPFVTPYSPAAIIRWKSLDFSCAGKASEHQGVFLEIHGKRVDFELREKLRQIRRELTDEEKAFAFSSLRSALGFLIFISAGNAVPNSNA